MRVHRHSIREGTRGWRRFASIYRDGDGGPTVVDARAEYYVFSGARHTGIALEFDDDTAGIQFSIGLAHVACIWLTVGSPWLHTLVYRRWKKSLPDVNIAEVRVHNRAIWWEIWHSKWEWKSGTPKWRYGSFHWWDWLTGKPVYRSEITEGPVRVGIPMPEGVYLATATLSRDTWTRPRWPWPLVRNGYDIKIISRPGPDGPFDPGLDPPNGYIPIPGKGESSYDCGPDGTFGQSGSARTIEDAIGQLVGGCLRDRKRRGGRHDYAEPIS